MLILGTLVVTWIVRNWWKILLLLIATIILREYQVHKHQNQNRNQNKDKEKNKAVSGTGVCKRELDIPPPFGRESKADKDIIEK